MVVLTAITRQRKLKKGRMDGAETRGADKAAEEARVEAPQTPGEEREHTNKGNPYH